MSGPQLVDPTEPEWTPTKDYLAALRREHGMYVAAGRDDRAAAVAEQLTACGEKPPARPRKGRDAGG